MTTDRNPLSGDSFSGCDPPRRRPLRRPISPRACVSAGVLWWRCSSAGLIVLTFSASTLLAAGRVEKSPRADSVATGGDSLRSLELLVNGGFEETKASTDHTVGWIATTNRRGQRVIVVRGRFPRSGSNYAELGGSNRQRTTLTQEVMLPGLRLEGGAHRLGQRHHAGARKGTTSGLASR